MDALKLNEHYTYADYLKWGGDVRYELIDGKPYLMSPAPSRKHQKISGEIFKQLANFLTGKPCEVYSAPFDVRLNADKPNREDDTVVQPDIVVVCDSSKLDDKGCAGSPDMVVEILSPSSANHDIIIKFKKYLEAGVREYWIVDPERKTLSAHILKDGQYVICTYGADEEGKFATAPVKVLQGCEIDLREVFSID